MGAFFMAEKITADRECTRILKAIGTKTSIVSKLVRVDSLEIHADS